MTYKQTGIKQIADDLKLKDFTWRPKSVHYDFDSRVARIEVLMWEKLAEHSRSFDLELPESKEDLSTQDVMAFLLALPQFKGSKEV